MYIAGMAAGQALKTTGVAVFVVDAAGRVHLMPASSIEIRVRPRLEDEFLDACPEDEALALLLKQGDDEDSIVAYLKRRAAKKGT